MFDRVLNTPLNTEDNIFMKVLLQKIVIFSRLCKKVTLKKAVGDHLFSKYAKYIVKLTFLTP